MIKTVSFFIFLTIFVWGHGLVNALDLSKTDLSYQYDLFDVLTFKSRVIDAHGEIQVFFQVTTDSVYSWERYFLVQKDYEAIAHDTLESVNLDTLFQSGNQLLCKLSLNPSEHNLLIISFEDSVRGVKRLFDVQVRRPSGFPSFLPVDQEGRPLLGRYVTFPDLSFANYLSNYHVYRYVDDFGPADPAMGIMKSIAPTLQIDSSFYFSGGLHDLDPYKFYLIQEDTLAEGGITILSCPAYYPEYRRLEELIGPLTYITTPNENKLLNEQMSRKTFENFWLNTYNTKLRAKTAIKVFYTKVEEANQLFTDYKQGWKTDRGMLYIIFGLPGQVVRTTQKEIWKYNDNLEFEFIRISTLFTPSLYSLKRDRKYEEAWYDQVGNIRKGL